MAATRLVSPRVAKSRSRANLGAQRMSRKQGVVTAFVKEIDAQNGRVKVEYRAIDEDLESAWAPIASPMSGKSRGMQFMPEAGDEVLVAFHDGQFDTPFIVGFL